MDSIDNETVLILTADLAENKNDILKAKKDDESLKSGIEDYYHRELKPNDIEVFEKHDNIYITEKGYFLAVYVSDIDEVVGEGEIENE